MARSDATLKRLLALHPKIIDLSLDRMERVLAALGNPERRLPPVIHVAGTNGKGSTIANIQACMEAAGRAVHVYTSPHLVRFHERIYIGEPRKGGFISEDALSDLLEECEAANGNEPITFFEITTAAALLAFSRMPADYCLLEVGLGGRLDATNVIATPKLTVITPVDIDHQQYLGETIEEIAAEKAGILKPGVTCVLGPQTDAVRHVIEDKAVRLRAPVLIAGQDFQGYEENGRFVFQDINGLLDLTLPKLPGQFQIENTATAIAALRALNDAAIEDSDIEDGISQTNWPARLQRLENGTLSDFLLTGSELWLDGGHNVAAGRAIAASLADFEERAPKPLVLIWGMLNTKAPEGFLMAFEGLAKTVITLAIPEEENAIPESELAGIAAAAGFDAIAAAGIQDALVKARGTSQEPVRVVICGSLYLAGHVLALETGDEKLGPSGNSR